MNYVYACRDCGKERWKDTAECPFCGSESKPMISFGRKPRQLYKSAVQGIALPSSKAGPTEVVRACDVDVEDLERISTGIPELDRVLGGDGAVPGSIILVGGRPGIGKSTLVTQALALGDWENGVYACGEESAAQVAYRCRRLGRKYTGIQLVEETNVDKLIATFEQLDIDMAVIDSIQTLVDPDNMARRGSTTALQTTTAKLEAYARRSGAVLFYICHVTKSGDLAGPMAVQHYVDCELEFLGEKDEAERFLRVHGKNRHGPNTVSAAFRMTSKGLVARKISASKAMKETQSFLARPKKRVAKKTEKSKAKRVAKKTAKKKAKRRSKK